MKRLFRNPFRRDAWRDELNEEFAFHVECRTRALMGEGMSRDAARAEALRRMGDLARVEEAVAGLQRKGRRRADLRALVEGTAQDVRFAVRALRRRPVATVLTVLTLGLGIGATTAVFSVARAVLWEPFPFADGDRVVSIRAVDTDGGGESDFGPAMLAWWREDADAFQGLTGVAPSPLTLTGLTDPVRVPTWQVTHGFFELLGVPLLLGRGFTAEEDRPGAPPATVLSHRIWRTEFGADPDVLGRALEIEGETATVVGVAPPSLDFSPEMPALYLPLRLATGQWENPSGGWLQILGRLRPGVPPEAARAELTNALVSRGISASLLSRNALVVRPLERTYTDPARLPLLVLLATVGLVLLVGCANIANLVLAQAVSRTREMAVRAAMGAGRGRVARLFLVESLVLGGAGALLGLLLAGVLVPGLVRLAPQDLPRLGAAGVDGAALTFALFLAVATAAVFGVVPAIRAGRSDLRAALGHGAGGLAGSGPGRTRTVLVGVQAGLCAILLAGSGLLLRTVNELAAVDAGFDRDVVTARVALRGDAYPGVDDAVRTFGEIRDRLAASPGVRSAAYTSRAPFLGSGFGLPMTRAGDAPAAEDRSVAMRIASPGYFRTTGVGLAAGREIAVSDDIAGGNAVVINRVLARTLGWPEPVDAVGRSVVAHGSDFLDGDGRLRVWEVVGVVDDSRTESLRAEPIPEAFFAPSAIPPATWSWIDREMVVAVRPEAGLASPGRLIREVLAATGARLPAQDIRTLGARVRESLATERMLTVLTTGLGLLALVLSTLGIFGAVAYAVSARVREIGLRMALGSSAGAVRRLVVGSALRPVLIGGVAGLVVTVAAAAGPTLEPLLFQVRGWDPWVVTGTVATLAGVAVLASWLPARRASVVDPARILAGE